MNTFHNFSFFYWSKKLFIKLIIFNKQRWLMAFWLRFFWGCDSYFRSYLYVITLIFYFKSYFAVYYRIFSSKTTFYQAITRVERMYGDDLYLVACLVIRARQTTRKGHDDSVKINMLKPKLLHQINLDCNQRERYSISE